MNIRNMFKDTFSVPHPRKLPKYEVPVSAAALKQIFSDCSDYNSRELAVGGTNTGLVTVCYLDGVIDGNFLSETIIRPLTDKRRLSGSIGARGCMDKILSGAVYCNNAVEKSTMDEVVEAVVKGFSVVIFEREAAAIAFETRSPVQRAISEPNLEKAVKGAKDAFIERLRINTTLVRRKLRTPGLKILRTVVGRRSDTEVAVLYLEGIANPKTVGELLRRLDSIDIDGVLASGNIEEYISDTPSSPFPQILHTERPDRFAINLLEGRVGILIDGLPLGFMLPGTLSEIMRVPEDRAQHFLVASMLRVLRYVAAVVTILLPAIYVAVAMYHQEMIPLKLLLSVIESKQAVPFSTGLEILALLFAFELLQEAGLRLPNPVGETMSIIGALIVGQSAVEAKVVSPIAVIVVAVAGITGYTMPSQDLSAALRLCRFFLVICALLAGMFGIMVGLVLIVYHLCSLESFGVSYLSPLTDGGPFGIFKMLLRPPLKKAKLREDDLNTPNKRNQA
ncbi:MAG: spore germination protein [Oscillospiraceae bacterium]